MLKPQNIVKGDKVAIVSLSRGLLGMPFCKHELNIALKRLQEYGLKPVIMPNALKDINYLQNHPEARAADLKQAFLDESIKMIICAIGGDDTYKLIPYLMEDKEFIHAVENNPKIFTGFSDTTINHLMLNKLGLSTFYGPCLLVDLAELDDKMLPYTKKYFDKYFLNEECFEIKSSNIWYKDRISYGVEEIGKPRVKYNEKHDYELLNGNGIVTGELYGGCIESIYNAMVGDRFKDEPQIINKYNIFPTLQEWKEKILFLETSESASKPEELENMLMEFKKRGIFNNVKGILVGKPIDEIYYEEYKLVYKKVFIDLSTPILYNINFGHSVPRCILPYNAKTIVDYDHKRIIVNEPILELSSNIKKQKTKSNT